MRIGADKWLYKLLHVMYSDFEEYMTAERWDAAMCGEGIYEDEGLWAVSSFIEFVLTGKVTEGSDDEGD